MASNDAMTSRVALFKQTPCYAEMSARVAQYKASDENARNVQACEDLKNVMIKHNEMKCGVSLHVKTIGPMPTNRKGEG